MKRVNSTSSFTVHTITKEERSLRVLKVNSNLEKIKLQKREKNSKIKSFSINFNTQNQKLNEKMKKLDYYKELNNPNTKLMNSNSTNEMIMTNLKNNMNSEINNFESNSPSFNNIHSKISKIVDKSNVSVSFLKKNFNKILNTYNSINSFSPLNIMNHPNFVSSENYKHPFLNKSNNNNNNIRIGKNSVLNNIRSTIANNPNNHQNTNYNYNNDIFKNSVYSNNTKQENLEHRDVVSNYSNYIKNNKNANKHKINKSKYDESKINFDVIKNNDPEDTALLIMNKQERNISNQDLILLNSSINDRKKTNFLDNKSSVINKAANTTVKNNTKLAYGNKKATIVIPTKVLSLDPNLANPDEHSNYHQYIDEIANRYLYYEQLDENNNSSNKIPSHNSNNNIINKKNKSIDLTNNNSNNLNTFETKEENRGKFVESSISEVQMKQLKQSISKIYNNKNSQISVTNTEEGFANGLNSYTSLLNNYYLENNFNNTFNTISKIKKQQLNSNISNFINSLKDQEKHVKVTNLYVKHNNDHQSEYNYDSLVTDTDKNTINTYDPQNTLNQVSKKKLKMYMSSKKNVSLLEAKNSIFKQSNTSNAINITEMNNANTTENASNKNRKTINSNQLVLVTEGNSFNNTLFSNEKRKLTKNYNTSIYNEAQSTSLGVINEDDKQQNNIGHTPFIPNKDNSIVLFAYYLYPKINFPEARESSTLAFGINKAYLYGGIDSSMSNKIWEFIPETLEWKKILPKNYPCVSKQRQGHTCCFYDNKLFFYGGKAKVGEFTFFPDLEVYVISEKSWMPPLLTTTVLKARKNHSANIFGNQMIIYGGISEDNHYQSDVYNFNLDTMKFSPIFIHDDAPGQQLAFHSACLVAPSEMVYSVKNHIYNYENSSKKKSSYPTGLYVFGGKTGDFSMANNDLNLLLLGRKPCEWTKIQTIGKAPCPRYSCSMNYYEEGNILIVHGGRQVLDNQNYGNLSEDDDLVLGDTYILNLFKLEWYSVIYEFPDLKYRVFSRFAHCSFIYTDKLIILGGGSNSKLIGSMLFIINLNNSKNSNLLSYHQVTENFVEQGRVGKDRLENYKKNKRKISMVDIVKLPMLEDKFYYYD